MNYTAATNSSTVSTTAGSNASAACSTSVTSEVGETFGKRHSPCWTGTSWHLTSIDCCIFPNPTVFWGRTLCKLLAATGYIVQAEHMSQQRKIPASHPELPVGMLRQRGQRPSPLARRARRPSIPPGGSGNGHRIFRGWDLASMDCRHLHNVASNKLACSNASTSATSKDGGNFWKDDSPC